MENKKKGGLVTKLKAGQSFTCNITGREIVNEGLDTIKIRISKPEGVNAAITEKEDEQKSK